MLKRLSDRMHVFSRGWVALLALAVFLLFTALALPPQSRQAEEAAGGAGAPDTTLFYSAADLYRMAEAYGPDGRQAYIRARFTFDVAWPLVYMFFLVTAISWLARRGFPAASLWRRANLVPIAAAVFDFLENFSTSLVMARYPAQTPVVDFLAPVFSVVKWVLVGGSFVVLVAVLVAAVVRRARRGEGEKEQHVP